MSREDIYCKAREMKRLAIEAVDAEEELPGEVPKHIENLIKNSSFDMLVSLFRQTVRATKRGIRDRIEDIEV
jgi:hypothetical protein